MTPHQRFRHGNIVESIAVRNDRSTGETYSRVADIQRIFPDVTLFKVNGVFINYLEDDNEQQYEPKRIAHYPNDIIDIIVSGPVLAPTNPPISSFGMTMAQTSNANSRYPSNLLSTDRVDQLVTDLSLQLSSSLLAPSTNSNSPTRSFTYSPSRSTSSSLTLSNNAAYQAVSIARPMVALSAIASDITHIQHQLDRSTDQQSTHYQQLLERLIQLLQEQADAKERDERVLAELEAAKARDEEMHRMQRQTIDRLIVAQQRIEAILVQNYELHEYPIPRLFVILPDSYERWDPRNILAKRFRLYFLCECGDHCRTDPGTTTSSGQLTITAASPATPIPVKNSIHLAKHDGYELSRPTEFFDSYGPYVLGMLRILKHCLAVATVVAPAVALADNTVKDVMDGVKSISESTMKAVDMSIDFLEQKLDGDALADGMTSEDAGPQEEEDMFSGLAALEGADLRRLDSFLRNKDADKILGNLYRITTDTGHVKWVCLDHYRQVYRETAMSSFLQCVESNGGAFDPQVGKVTVSLKSAIAARDFFNRLAQHAPAVTALDITLDWSFGSADLAMIVDKTLHSNVCDFTLSTWISVLTTLGLAMRPGKGRYHSLLGLFSNTKIKRLAFTTTNLIGLPTASLPTSHSPSFLQSFHYTRSISGFEDSRVADIIRHCPHLVDLRLGGPIFSGSAVSKIERAIGSLSKLAVLHRYRLHEDSSSPPEIKNDTAPYGTVALRELVDFVLPYPTGPNGFLESAIRRSSDTLEVLLLRTKTETALNLVDALGPFSAATNHSRLPLRKLTHLMLLPNLTPASFELMASILARLSLLHLDVRRQTCRLLTYVNLSVLKSLYLFDPEADVIDTLSRAVLNLSSCQIESLYLARVPMTPGLLDVISFLPLKRLYIFESEDSSMTKILQLLNLSQLQVLTIEDDRYDWAAEEVLAGRSSEFLDRFLLQLQYNNKDAMRDIHKQDARDLEGSPTRLARHRVRLMTDYEYVKEYFAMTLPAFAR
ncbi:MAG: hypothetical protein J3R72DRAFT_472204 [Linnemannia gamsii]|nr:MAG: hypothetical protein J3R72DRAFT_472204 [Linnemannia gamsii]